MITDGAPSRSSLFKQRVLKWPWPLLPPVVWMTAFFFLPLVLVFAVSFASRGVYGGVEWTFTATNYAVLLDPLYARIYLRSLILAALTTALCLLIGFPLAYYIARAPVRRQGVWLLLVIVPFWTNFLVRTYAWMFLLRSDGPLNAMLLRLGIIETPLQVLHTDLAVLIGLVYGYLPFMVLPLYAAIVRLDRSVVEAAWDLYASGPTVFRRVVVPLIRPGIVAGCLLVFIPSLGAYITPDLLGGARSMMIGNLVQHEYLVVRDWPFGSAISFALVAVVVVALAGYAKYGGLFEDQVPR
ncbi:ABC transporter permease [Candidatus Nitrospira bockiana]